MSIAKPVIVFEHPDGPPRERQWYDDMAAMAAHGTRMVWCSTARMDAVEEAVRLEALENPVMAKLLKKAGSLRHGYGRGMELKEEYALVPVYGGSVTLEELYRTVPYLGFLVANITQALRAGSNRAVWILDAPVGLCLPAGFHRVTVPEGMSPLEVLYGTNQRNTTNAP